MKIDDLDLRELLELAPKGGVIRFAGERVILMDTVALGLLRRELIETVGVTVARGVLTRFGYAHGWRTAQAMRTQFPDTAVQAIDMQNASPGKEGNVANFRLDLEWHTTPVRK